MFTLQTKFIALILFFACILGVGYSAYSYIYSKGHIHAQQECEERFAKYQKELDAKVEKLESNLATLAATNQDQQILLNSDISEILNRVKKSQVTIVKNGKCYPSPTFVEGVNQAIDRANKK